MSLLKRTARATLAPCVRLYDRLRRPSPMQRTPERQAEVDLATQRLVLYHFQTCPFCVRVRHKIAELGLDIEMRDTLLDPHNRQALAEGGGKTQVPCLLITDEQGNQEWLYESADINRYLVSRFG
ncbi:glutaredoxin family protein [Halotalea alkalilenta]|uniref:glutaredoxin family protein n=1 Tax=Halotalea alkalilenta TaxID=376489 RepID=UPI00048593C1|nr:glutathione S-transferase N-terminal domain-containing protein [Halotalea alkalilenta]